jgi:hypothetical protein
MLPYPIPEMLLTIGAVAGITAGILPSTLGLPHSALHTRAWAENPW